MIGGSGIAEVASNRYRDANPVHPEILSVGTVRLSKDGFKLEGIGDRIDRISG
jgi:hypothetical protein